MWNLVSNAVKFTPRGGRILVRSYNDEKKTLIIEVSDTGVGIPDDVLPRFSSPSSRGKEASPAASEALAWA